MEKGCSGDHDPDNGTIKETKETRIFFRVYPVRKFPVQSGIKKFDTGNQHSLAKTHLFLFAWYRDSVAWR
jgi:hypothetical protein